MKLPWKGCYVVPIQTIRKQTYKVKTKSLVEQSPVHRMLICNKVTKGIFINFVDLKWYPCLSFHFGSETMTT